MMHRVDAHQIEGKVVRGCSQNSHALVITFTDGTYLNVQTELDDEEYAVLVNGKEYVYCAGISDEEAERIGLYTIAEITAIRAMRERERKERWELEERQAFERLRAKYGDKP